MTKKPTFSGQHISTSLWSEYGYSKRSHFIKTLVLKGLYNSIKKYPKEVFYKKKCS